jgi:hypothetical protein
MAGRAFKGWGLLLNSFNRGFNPGSFVSGAERATANAQRRDDIARAGAIRQQDKQEAAEATRRANNDTMLSRVAADPEDWQAAYRVGWRPGGEVDQSVFDAVRGAQRARAATAAAQARAAAEAKDAQALRKREAELKKAEIAAGPGNARVNLKRRLALGAELFRMAGNDPQKAETIRRSDRRYWNAILPGPDRGGAATHVYGLDRAAPLQRFNSRIRALGLEGFTKEYPVVQGLLKQYTASKPSAILRVGDEARDAIMALRGRDQEAAKALEDIIVEMQQRGRVIVGDVGQ